MPKQSDLSVRLPTFLWPKQYEPPGSGPRPRSPSATPEDIDRLIESSERGTRFVIALSWAILAGTVLLIMLTIALVTLTIVLVTR